MTTNNKPRSFKVDARALLSLGRESIKDHTTAVIELVKNSYDADAENVEVEVDERAGVVRIADDGSGMTSADIDEKWLRIGYSHKRKTKRSAAGRRETGEKGIGRLSADRLGAVLELRSKKKSSDPVGVRVNWDDFDVDGKNVEAVQVDNLNDPSPLVRKRPAGGRGPSQGTEIRIRKLRQSWDSEDLETLETELSTLVPPGASGVPFSIWLRTNGQEFRELGSAFEGQAELVFSGVFSKTGRLTYVVTGRPKGARLTRPVVARGSVLWGKLVSSPKTTPYNIGPIEVQFSFFLRSSVSLSGGISLKQLREYLDTAGGVRIYRDKMRVKPYGDPKHPEGDWLGLAKRKTLNPAGAARADFRISANQLVGAVQIGRDGNPALADSAAREGLIHSDGYALLKKAVYGCIALLESVYHKQFKARKEEGQSSNAQLQLPLEVEEIKTALSDVGKNLAAATRSSGTPQSAKLLQGSVEKLEVVVQRFSNVERGLEELASQATVYRGLATVGIASAVFGHETESSLSQAKLSTVLAKRLLASSSANNAQILKELEKVEKAVDRINLWGQFAISRVKNEKRKRSLVDLSATIALLVREVKPLFNASKIEVVEEVAPGVQVRAFAMDIESLVLNLLTNAFHAAGQKPSNRMVTVSMAVSGTGKARSATLKVADSGHGIAKEHLLRIWEPLFSTRTDNKGRPTGTGLGLTIVQSVTNEMGAAVTALPHGALGGAEFQVQLPVG